MDPNNHIFIQELQPGAEIASTFLLGAAQQMQAKNGPYWRLEFRDASGSIGAKIWSPHSAQYTDLSAGLMVHVTGRIISYRDTPEISVDALRILPEQELQNLDLSLFIRSSITPTHEMLEELEALCQKNMTHKPWLKFTRLVIKDETIRAGLHSTPAAKVMHHAYAGGLLEHTLSVCKSCLLLATQYPHIDKQVLLAGALCHDLGKIWEISSGLAVEYTQAGQLLGHIHLSLERLTPLMHKAGLEPELVEHLQHLIISHHGKFEFGALKLPATAEALVLHYADDLDAKINQVANLLSDVEDGQSGWSAYSAPLNRSLFKAMPSPCAPLPSNENKKKSAKNMAETPLEPLPLISQCSLLLKE